MRNIRSAHAQSSLITVVWWNVKVFMWCIRKAKYGITSHVYASQHKMVHSKTQQSNAGHIQNKNKYQYPIPAPYTKDKNPTNGDKIQILGKYLKVIISWAVLKNVLYIYIPPSSYHHPQSVQVIPIPIIECRLLLTIMWHLKIKQNIICTRLRWRI